MQVVICRQNEPESVGAPLTKKTPANRSRRVHMNQTLLDTGYESASDSAEVRLCKKTDRHAIVKVRWLRAGGARRDGDVESVSEGLTAIGARYGTTDTNLGQG